MEPPIYLAVVSRYHSYINSAKEILGLYKGAGPLASFLKKHFSSSKKYGSKDRRQIAHLCYSYFRLGKMALNVTIDERILIALFLCSDKPNEMLAALKPGWNENVSLPVELKCSMLNVQCSIPDIFPWEDKLSGDIEFKKFCESFLMQPALFIRIRPGKQKKVINKLVEAKLEFRNFSESCLELINSTSIDELITIDEDVLIQDRNSQKTGGFISYALASIQKRNPLVWDCCAASGGKSIMAYDINPNIDLTVSDVRESILANLKKRFQRAGIKNYKSFVADLTEAGSGMRDSQYDIIICDAPCTGSGTWSRTPEQLYSFDESEIDRYSSLQRKIVSGVIPHLQAGGLFVYITCSVFRKENEEIVEFIKQNFHLQLKQMEVLKGYDKKADSMFVAVLSLPKHGKIING